jgi:class 3 adenylate cyclase
VDPSGDGGGGLTATGLFCGSCGAQSSPTAKFCGECGKRLTHATRSAEYKQVTVLFADVVHSMDIAATVGTERLREVMADLADRCAAVVERYGGTVDKFTGDGIMAVFGAPVALEDHAVRACLAALGIQEETARLAAEVKDRGVDLRLRVGLNSGEVIAGEIGSGPFGYTAVGEQVGMAQRMESVAPPGEVMLSAPTARLVEHHAVLSEPEIVHIKGSDQPVAGRRLLGVPERDRRGAGAQSTLVGRRWEMAAIEALLERAIDSHGAVVTVVGLPGIGKSRLVREVSALAAARGVEVFSTFCESHATDVPFRVVVRLLRTATGVRDLEDAHARGRVRARVRAVMPDADPEDILLLDDLMGIADPNVVLPRIDPDARRRRLVNAASLARKAPAVYVVEDTHWIDQASESMLADLVTVIPQTHSLVLITYRPEYTGALSRVPGAQSIALAPLTDPETATLVSQLLGPEPSVGELGHMIAERAAGNPFFAEEMVHELAERGVLRGNRGTYTSTADVAEVNMPATVQATIAARIDRLDPKAKRTLSTAAVIGAKFSRDLLETLGIDPVLQDLVGGELIDQIRFTRQPEYVFHHPLIRTVAYESQLKSARAELHRRVAAAIEARGSASVDENAALIAEHLEAAGDLHAAYGWHMRAATWATNRDIAAARQSWERAQRIADALPTDDPGRAAMRIVSRTMLCATAIRVHAQVAGARFDELRELCTAAGDKASLAIAMAGLVIDHVYQGRVREASQLASENMALIEAIGDAALTVGLSTTPIVAKIESGEWCDVLRWSQRVIELADGDPSKGNFLVGSPLALALTFRAMARYCLGRPGWRDDLQQALAMARRADPLSYARVVTYIYAGIPGGVLTADDRAVREIEDALQMAERSGDDVAVVAARMTLGFALVHRQTAAERDRGYELLAEVSDVFRRRGNNLAELPIVNVYLARERARREDRDEAIPLMRAAVDDLVREGQLLAYGVPATCVLVETLLDRGADGDVPEAEAAIERLAAAPTDDGLVLRDIWLLRLQALLARAHRDDAACAHLRDRYRDMARTLGFEGHIAWAEAMP